MRAPELGDTVTIPLFPPIKTLKEIKWYSNGDQYGKYYVVTGTGYNGGGDITQIPVFIQGEWYDFWDYYDRGGAANVPNHIRNHGKVEEGKGLKLVIDTSFKWGYHRDPGTPKLKPSGEAQYFLVYHDAQRNLMMTDFFPDGGDTNLKKFK